VDEVVAAVKSAARAVYGEDEQSTNLKLRNAQLPPEVRLAFISTAVRVVLGGGTSSAILTVSILSEDAMVGS
jgi:hypothetical protein